MSSHLLSPEREEGGRKQTLWRLRVPGSPWCIAPWALLSRLSSMEHGGQFPSLFRPPALPTWWLCELDRDWQGGGSDKPLAGHLVRAPSYCPHSAPSLLSSQPAVSGSVGFPDTATGPLSDGLNPELPLWERQAGRLGESCVWQGSFQKSQGTAVQRGCAEG